MGVVPWLMIAVLIAANALYVAAEFAAVGVRRSRIRQLADEGNRFARMLAPALSDASTLDRYVAACQIGITLSSLVLGAYGQAALAPPFAELLGSWGQFHPAVAESAAAVVVLIGLTVLQVVLGELVPKSLALQYSTSTALYTVLPMRWSLALFAWFIAILNGSGLAILRMLGVPYGSHRHVHSPEEIDLLIAESRDGGLLEEDEHQRLHEALHLATLTARELMVPRRQIEALPADTPLDEALDRIGEAPFTRWPVYEGTLDHIIGMVHAKDLMLQPFGPQQPCSLADAMRPAVFVPESVTADRILAILREKRTHQAIVFDEYGGTAGLVTIEDVLSELLGEVEDEFKGPWPRPERLPDGRVRLPGSLHLEAASEWVGVRWEGSSVTVGGYITEVLGRIPAPGEVASLGDIKVEVESVEHRAVASVLVSLPPPTEDGD